MGSKKKKTEASDNGAPVAVGDRVVFHEKHGRALVAKPADVCGVGHTRFERRDTKGDTEEVELEEGERYWTADLAIHDARRKRTRYVGGVRIADEAANGVCTL